MGQAPQLLADQRPIHEQNLIRDFTSEEARAVEGWLGPEYERIRQAEQRGDTSDQFVNSFHAALEKVPHYQGALHRGLFFTPGQTVPKFNVGDVLSTDSTQSCSKQGAIAEAYAMRERPGHGKYHELTGIVIHINAKTAADLSPYQRAMFQHEHEVVLRKGSEYKVSHVEETPTYRTDDDDKFYGRPRSVTHVYVDEIV